jgi:hypothetical protein
MDTDNLTTCENCDYETAAPEWHTGGHYSDDGGAWLCGACFAEQRDGHTVNEWRDNLNDIRHALDEWDNYAGAFHALERAARLVRELADAITERESEGE